ncbi:MAG TPA: MXAN_5187 C-terminal domain-containing protein [Polyangiaceae bacterium]|nr:MXAN_5187 C-terminal domain-containing protein [Polyangiaceae bacterium]
MEPTEIEKSVGDLEVAVDRLRSLYEQYFMGIEKLEPTVPRKDVDRRIYALRKEQIRNTAMRFRFQMILQRYNVYQTHWQRICREIENGTYKRHMLRAERRFGEEAPGRKRRTSTLPPPNATPARDIAKELAELDADFAPPPQEMQLDDADLMLEEEPSRGSAARALQKPAPTSAQTPAQVQERKGPVWRKVEPAPPRNSSPPPPGAAVPRPQIPGAPKAPGPMAAPFRAPARAPAPAAARPAAPAPAPAAAASPRANSEDLPDARVRQIYAQYVDAKRRGNESTAAITYEAVAKSLRESSAKLREKTGKAVDFEVAMKDGKAILKPVIK